ncbi:hypothetical protein [Bradyrhizobium sp. WSM2254]|uniref:hypothetical protein n=1 Tax=Bradyrhizobium sp. WSM2254 TaxID=1188263 RepID=UPI0012EC34E8|nr:hypothetical protein [Bradyrhizobium sp. WSM2254]
MTDRDMDSLAGTAKQLLAEIVGDGKLAAEGSRQAAAGDAASAPEEGGQAAPQTETAAPRDEPTARFEASSS